MLLDLDTATRTPTRTRVLGSVVIPAHNEAAVIGRCLDALFDGMDPEELEVVVVCNGCTDETAELARSTDYPIRVLELPVGAKAPALRLGEAATTALPRLYLDADVVLPGASARRVLEALDEGAVAARPPVRYDSDGASWVVRRYYGARARVPALLGALWGAGIYGVSETGRSRFTAFPDVLADDLWIDRQFSRDEITIVDCQPVVVTVPKTMGSLLPILRRANRGKTSDASHITATAQTQSRRTTLGTVKGLLKLAGGGPQAALDAFVYAGVAVLTRLTREAAPAGVPTGWERDESSRSVLV